MLDNGDIDEILSDLRYFDLSEGEAKTYLSIAILQQAKASEIAEYAGILKTKIYSYLNNLIDRNLVVKYDIEGSPNTFEIINLEQDLHRIKPDVSQIISNTISFVNQARSSLNTDAMEQEQYVRVLQGDRIIQQMFQSLPQTVEDNIMVFYHQSYNKTLNQFRQDNPELKIIEPQHELMKQQVIQSIIQLPNFGNIIGKREVMLMFEDINQTELTCQAVNIVAYPGPDLDLDPLLIRITHPIIVQLQLTIISNFIKFTSNETDLFNLIN